MSSSTDAASAQWTSSSDEHERPAHREPLEQLPHGAMGAVALVLHDGRRRPDARSDSEGITCASSLRTSSRSDAISCGSRPARYSSRASTKTQNGRSRSSSDALPAEDGAPAGVGALRPARPAASSCRSRARPRSPAAPAGRRPARRARDRSPPARRRARRDGRRLRSRVRGLLGEHNPAARSGCEIRVPARCRGAASAGVCAHALLPHPSPPRAAAVRRRLRQLQGLREPPAPPPRAGLLSGRRPRHLVDRRGQHDEDALRQLPFFVAQRSTVTRVAEVEIP